MSTLPSPGKISAGAHAIDQSKSVSPLLHKSRECS